MRLIGDDSVGVLRDGGFGGGGGAVVVVGVKLDGESKELLTWAMVKVAQPGDHVIAVHVLKSASESTSSLLSLVKTFDSVLSVYEGFCNLKQVDLKLKVLRGPSVRKILVREAQSYGVAKVIVGSSRTPHTIRSSRKVAKYCARKLSKSFSVLAVENGKVVFERKANNTNTDLWQDHIWPKNCVGLGHETFIKNIAADNASDAVSTDYSDQESPDSSRKSSASLGKKSQKKSIFALQDDSATKSLEIPAEDFREDNSLALVPYNATKSATSSNAIILRNSAKSKSSWSLLRWKILSSGRQQETVRNICVFHRILGLPNRCSHALVHPDQQNNANKNENQRCNLEGENGAIVPIGHEVSCPHLSFKSPPKELEDLQDKYSSTCRLFSYQELLTATSNFIPGNLVGKGGNSHVYKGCLPDGKELAVKILKPSEDVLKDFVSEIDIIMKLHHKNVISLFGFCFEENNLILVYDYLSRGSLEENLHGNRMDVHTFGWKERYKVALGVAEALNYLHNGCDEPVIHRDVKTSNILLSDDFKPQLSDFGLANWISEFSNITCTDVAGTFGYLAPEYFMHGRMSDKIDVYAYGVVLLELLSGRMPINNEYPKGKESLVMWAKPILKDGKVSQLLDQRLGSDYNHDDIERMVLAAALCIRCEPRLRPQISVIFKLLQGDEEITEWGRQQVSASEELDAVDEESFPTNIQSHLNLALLDLEDDSLSISSTEQSVGLEEYLQGRWSRTSSFD